MTQHANDGDMSALLYGAMFDALSEVEKEHVFTRGDVMTAALFIIVATGLSDPRDTAERLKAEVHEALDNSIATFRDRAGH